MDPAAAVKKVADELQEKADEAGLGGADAFTDKLEDIKEKVSKGPGDILEAMKGKLDDLKTSLSNVDASSLGAPSALAACAGYYAAEVVKKLKGLAQEVEALFSTLVKLAGEVLGPFKEVGEALQDAMAGIGKTVKGLSNLPKDVQKLANSAKGPDDVAKIDTAPMKKSLDTSAMNAPLDKLGGINSTFAPVIENLKNVAVQLEGFLGDAPDKVRAAFAAPFPLCCATGAVMANAPPAMTETLKKLEDLKKVDLGSVLGMCDEVSDTLGNLDLKKVKDPVQKFSESAAGPIDNLDNAVKAAKMTSGGGAMGAVGGMLG